MTSLRTRLANGDLLLGVIMTVPSPELAETIVESGADWLFLDMEHGRLELTDVQRIVQAVGHRCPCLVRVPVAAAPWISRALDTGAAGIVAPQVNNAETAAHVATESLFPPIGTRGAGASRALGYANDLATRIKAANAQTVVVIQIETPIAVARIQELLTVSGAHAVFIGPYDLSVSLGVPGDLEHPEVLGAIERIAEACQTRGIPFGYPTHKIEAVTRARAHGATLLTVGLDTGFVRTGSKAAFTAARA
jgi:2-keto-3-deoxy-L-rhamnonate aldolase RhmA